MPEHQTSVPWLLPYPDPTGKVKLGATNFKELAERLTTIFKERFLTVAEHGASFTAASGELVKCTAAITVTLPAASANAIVGVLANGHEVKVGAGAAVIYGDFITGTTPITLLGYQHVVLQSDGTNWFIIAGEPNREQGYVAEAEVGTITPGGAAYKHTYSPTRPAFVNYRFVVSAVGTKAGKLEIKIGGVLVWDPTVVVPNTTPPTFSTFVPANAEVAIAIPAGGEVTQAIIVESHMLL